MNNPFIDRKLKDSSDISNPFVPYPKPLISGGPPAMV